MIGKLAVVLLLVVPLGGQTINDGVMIPKHILCFGDLYSHDSWSSYWEGHLSRTNGNLGTVTTQTNTWSADYGLTSKIDILASVPYVWTNASRGVLHSMQGFQDITLAAKYNFLEKALTERGMLRAIAVVSGATPLTNYEPAFQPLSIGNQSTRISGRFTLNFQARRGWYINASPGYTWRGAVAIDAPYYYTNGQLFLTNNVDMPGVFDYAASSGYRRGAMMLEGFFSQQRTQGGGEIRRQDMPFISNRMNYSKVGASVAYPIPKLRDVAIHFIFAYTPDGRNVGQSSTYTTGLMYTVRMPGGRKIP